MRRYRRSDLDDITSIYLAAFKNDPEQAYRFPFAAKYPEESLKYTRQRYSEYMDGAEDGDYEIMVVEGPSNADPATKSTIAFSIWELPGAKDQKVVSASKAPTDRYERKDGAPARMKAFREALAKCKEAWFTSKFGTQQLTLMMLGTRPDYERRGAGTMLTKWGLARAKDEKIPVTLFSSPMAEKLYATLGFREVGVVHVQVEGEPEFMEFPGMVWEAKTSKGDT